MDTAVLTLLNNLNENNAEQCIASLKKLGERKSREAAEEIAELLDSSNWEIRKEAATTLGLIGSRKALVKLMERLEEEETSPVQTKILGAVSLIGGKGATRKIREILVDPASCLHKNLIEAFIETGSGKEFEEELTELLHMAEYPWKDRLIDIAKHLPAKKAEQYLLEIIIGKNNDDTVAKAVRALEKYPSTRNWSEVAPLLSAKNEETRIAAIRTLRAWNGRKLISTSSSLLVTGSQREKVLLIKNIASNGSVEHSEMLISLCLAEKDPSVIEEVIKALIQTDLQSPGLISSLTGFANHPSPAVRANLAELMGKPGLPSTLSAFSRLAQDSHRGVRRATARALSRINDDGAISILIRLTEDRSADVRLNAIRGACVYRRR